MKQAPHPESLRRTGRCCIWRWSCRRGVGSSHSGWGWRHPADVGRSPAGDGAALRREIAAARQIRPAGDCAVRSCYEAGRDAFWVHRLLERRR